MTENTVVYSPKTGTIHEPRGRGTKPACAGRLTTADFSHYRIAFGHAVDGSRCQHPECFGGEDG